MGIVSPRRARYRVRQFAWAVCSYLGGLQLDEWAEIEGVLPVPAVQLFRRMSKPDQLHGLNVMRSLKAGGFEENALLQAALLHDVAKHTGGVTLPHRVAVVLIKAFLPKVWRNWLTSVAPSRSKWSHPFWSHAHHAEIGARMAQEADCGPLAVALITLHQEGSLAGEVEARLLAALRAADDEN